MVAGRLLAGYRRFLYNVGGKVIVESDDDVGHAAVLSADECCGQSGRAAVAGEASGAYECGFAESCRPGQRLYGVGVVAGERPYMSAAKGSCATPWRTASINCPVKPPSGSSTTISVGEAKRSVARRE